MEKNKNTKNTFHTSEVVFLLILTCLVSIFMGRILSFQTPLRLETDSENALFAKLLENYAYIKENYYEEVEDSKLLNGAIAGMIDALDDPYSSFFDVDYSENFNLSLDGNYSGIGIEIINNNENNIEIVTVFANSPAEQAGLHPGDVITEIDHNSLLGKDKSELTNYVKQNALNEFMLTVLRNGESISVSVKKTTVEIPSVRFKQIEQEGKKIGYIYFGIFSATTYSQFQHALQELETKGMDSLIIDVRENSGGHLSTAVQILSLFLDSSNIIYQIELKGKTTKYYADGTQTKTYPIVVLQNENSASASELLSAALKETYGATIIGETSYGKGTVQELRKLEDGSEYKVTTKKWLTPKGNWIHKKGITPDIEVELHSEYLENPNDSNDNQLQEAIRYLIK